MLVVKRYGAVSADGILLFLLLRVESTDLRRFSLELGALNLHEGHESLVLTVGGGFPDLRNGDWYNARNREIFDRSIGYVLEHLERGPRAWMERAFSQRGHLAALSELEGVNPALWRTGHVEQSMATGWLCLGDLPQATELFERARERYLAVQRERPQCDWADEGATDCARWLDHLESGGLAAVEPLLAEGYRTSVEKLGVEKLLPGFGAK